MEIGGYFELELRKGKEYHKGLVHLNTGRNALELIFRTRKYSKVYIPFYTCAVILEPFHKLGVKYEFYSIDKKLEPIFDYTNIKPDEGFLYTNYFGLKDSFIKKIAYKFKTLIVDNSQAFYSLPFKDVDTFYSARKFFGVPDGAYLYMGNADIPELPVDISLYRFMHLIKRIDMGPEAGYADFRSDTETLVGNPILQMSKLTKALMLSIDYKFVLEKRLENFRFLYEHLKSVNELKISLNQIKCPMVYPLLFNSDKLRTVLIKEKIFIPVYWENVIKNCSTNIWEYYLAKNMLPLPICQRYGTNELLRIVDRIFNNIHQ